MLHVVKLRSTRARLAPVRSSLRAEGEPLRECRRRRRSARRQSDGALREGELDRTDELERARLSARFHCSPLELHSTLPRSAGVSGRTRPPHCRQSTFFTSSFLITFYSALIL